MVLVSPSLSFPPTIFIFFSFDPPTRLYPILSFALLTS